MKMKLYTSAGLFELINNRLCEKFMRPAEDQFLFYTFHNRANVCGMSVKISDTNWVPYGVLRYGEPDEELSYLDVFIEGIVDESCVIKRVYLGCYKIHDDDFDVFKELGRVYSEFIKELIRFRNTEWESEVSDR